MPKKIADLIITTNPAPSDLIPFSHGASASDRGLPVSYFDDKIQAVDDKASLSPFIGHNIKEHGVIGNGVADDTEAMQTFFDGLPDNSAVYIPKGRYKVSDPIEINVKGTKIFAQKGAIIDGTDITIDATKAIVWFREDDQMIDGLAVDGGRDHTAGSATLDGIRTGTGVKNYIIKNSTVYNCPQFGIHMYRGKNGQVINNTVHSCRWGICPSDEYTTTIDEEDGQNFIISGNLVYDIFFDGITVRRGAVFVTINDNIVRNTGHSAISVTSGRFVAITGNTVSGVRGAGSQDDREAGIEVESRNVRGSENVTATGNIIYDCEYGLKAGPQRLPSGDPTTKNVIFSDNVIKKCDNAIALLGKGDAVLVHDNLFVDVDEDGDYEPAQVTNVSFKGNAGLKNIFDNGRQWVKQNELQSFFFIIRNDGGTLQHRIAGDALAGGSADFANKINGANDSYTNTVMGADETTAMENGGKISSENVREFILDTDEQIREESLKIANVVQNITGTALLVRPILRNLNVNGETKRRLHLAFFDAASGNAFNLNTTNIGAGEHVGIQFLGYIK